MIRDLTASIIALLTVSLYIAALAIAAPFIPLLGAPFATLFLWLAGMEITGALLMTITYNVIAILAIWGLAK